MRKRYSDVMAGLDGVMDGSARNIDPAAHSLWREANREWKELNAIFRGNKDNRSVLNAFMRAEPDAAARMLVKNRRPAFLQKVKERIGPKAWERVRGEIYLELSGGDPMLEASADAVAAGSDAVEAELVQIANNFVARLKTFGPKALTVIEGDRQKAAILMRNARAIKRLARTESFAAGLESSGLNTFLMPPFWIRMVQAGALTSQTVADLLDVAIKNPSRETIGNVFVELIKRTPRQTVRRIGVETVKPGIEALLGENQ